MPPGNVLENIVILCDEKRFSKQNSVIRLKSNIGAPQNFWAGYATAVDLTQIEPQRYFTAVEFLKPLLSKTREVDVLSGNTSANIL